MSENTTDQQFVVELLLALKRERFSPAGWWHFLAASWDRSLATAREHPALVRSWQRTTLSFALFTACIVLVTALISGVATAFRLLPGFALCVAWQQSDQFWHLGLNRSARSGQLFERVGLANTLTGLRGIAASYLLGRLVGGLATPSSFALLIFSFGVATDVLDGLVARVTRTESRLGQIMDGGTDFCLYLALTLILLQNHALPLWLALVMLLRFCVPLFAALFSYFLFARPVRFGSTLWGKAAGVAQSLYFFLLLAPSSLTPLAHIINTPVLLITLALLVIAPIAQIVDNI